MDPIVHLIGPMLANPKREELMYRLLNLVEANELEDLIACALTSHILKSLGSTPLKANKI